MTTVVVVRFAAVDVMMVKPLLLAVVAVAAAAAVAVAGTEHIIHVYIYISSLMLVMRAVSLLGSSVVFCVVVRTANMHACMRGCCMR